MAHIHCTAIVDSRAELGQNVVVGPFCIVEAGAIIGEGCQLEARAIIKSRTTLGCNNEIGQGAVIGGKAQHIQVHEPGGTLTLGDHNRIRENVTIHRGWANDATTEIGDHNLLLAGSHVGHDCRVGNYCTLVEHALLGGFVQFEDRALLGGGSVAVPFCRIGRLAMVGAMTKITMDVPPFVMVDRSQVVGLNKVGLRRSSYTPGQVLQLKRAYRVIYRQGLRWSEILAMLKSDFHTDPTAAFYDFLSSCKRGFVKERRISRRATLKPDYPASDDLDEARDRQRVATEF